MSSYKLTGFSGQGRAEFIRLIFAQAGVKYEDVRITPEQWPEFKTTTPFGWLPILEDSGDHTVLSGSTPIARYLAEKYRLAGTTCLQNAEICSIVDATLDVWNHIQLTDLSETNETVKAQKLQDYIEQQIPNALENFERKAAANSQPEGWIYGEKVTYADFAVYHLIEYAADRGVDVSGDRYPALLRLKASVEGLPNITKWLHERKA